LTWLIYSSLTAVLRAPYPYPTRPITCFYHVRRLARLCWGGKVKRGEAEEEARGSKWVRRKRAASGCAGNGECTAEKRRAGVQETASMQCGEQARRKRQAGSGNAASGHAGKCGERARRKQRAGVRKTSSRCTGASKRAERRRAEVVQMEVRMCSAAEKNEKGVRGCKNREFCASGALCSGLVWWCGFCQRHLYQRLCCCVLLGVPLAFLSRKSFMSISKVSVLKLYSAIRPHYCFYVPLVLVSSLSLLRIWAVARVDT
jgi:hypothetical protein